MGDDDEAEINSFCEGFISDVISRTLSPPPRSPSPFFPPEPDVSPPHAAFDERTPPVPEEELPISVDPPLVELSTQGEVIDSVIDEGSDFESARPTD